ncbi:MAG: GDYXXLXY domain-containing protein [Candidatus Omnitrophica bacterium]|nr:GDYXXLXY domain-containing protein [Candidatus Omnitrophota bacterium]
MNKKLIFGLFFILAVLQLAVGFSMIAQREKVLRQGKQFRFKTIPVDPYDAFRGRYIALRIGADKVKKPQGLNLQYGERVYALISVNSQGFAEFSELTKQRPQTGDFIESKVNSFSGDYIMIELPFERYYMQEEAAPSAEKVYQQRARDRKEDTYITVRVKDGFGVIEGLYIGTQRIEDYIKGK